MIDGQTKLTLWFEAAIDPALTSREDRRVSIDGKTVSEPG